MDAAGLRFVFCKLYLLFNLDYHSTGGYIQNKESKDDFRRQKGRSYRRERHNGTDCGGFEACLASLVSSNLPFISTPLALHIL